MLRTPEAVLRQLVDAIDDNVHRRVLLDKQPTERRTEAVVVMRDIADAYVEARQACQRNEQSILHMLNTPK